MDFTANYMYACLHSVETEQSVTMPTTYADILMLAT